MKNKIYYLIYFLYFLLLLFAFYILSEIMNPIENRWFNYFDIIISILLGIFNFLLLLILKKRLKKHFWELIFSGIVFMYFFSSVFILYINNMWGNKEIILESKIYHIQKASSRADGMFKLKIDNELVNVNVINPCYKVGDTYKIIIYEGWLGIKYYIPHGGRGYYEKNLDCKKNKEKSKYEKTVISKKEMYKNKIYRRESILDNAINNKNYKFIHYLKQHGAKRSCEILKTKCKPLSPEIEKILKNDKK